MGGGIASIGTAEVTSEFQEIVNNIFQKAQQTVTTECIIECSELISDIDITIIDSDVGEVSIKQECIISGSCEFTRYVEAFADFFQEVEQAASEGTPVGSAAQPLFEFFSLDVTTIEQSSRSELTSIITQTLESRCVISGSEIIDNVSIELIGSSVDTVSISQAITLEVKCIEDTILSLDTSIVQRTTQTAEEGVVTDGSGGGISTGTWIAIGAGILLVIVIIVVVIVIIYRRNKKKKLLAAATAAVLGAYSGKEAPTLSKLKIFSAVSSSV